MIAPTAGPKAPLIADHLLQRFGSITDVFSSLLDGAGSNIDPTLCPAPFLRDLSDALVALAAREAMPPLIGEDLRKFMVANLGGRGEEALLALFLDQDTRCLDARILGTGDHQQVSIKVRLLLRQALITGAEAIILAHNHPRGNPEPSNVDYQSTTEIEKALDVIGVRLVDHFVIAGECIFSIRHAALLDGCYHGE